jgi:hypothetical protein
MFTTNNLSIVLLTSGSGTKHRLSGTERDGVLSCIKQTTAQPKVKNQFGGVGWP